MAEARSDHVVDSVEDASAALHIIGGQIREYRMHRGLTLEALGQATGLSASMLSLVERGKASPSIGSLVAISSALGVHMTDLLSPEDQPPPDPISRKENQPVYHSAQGPERRVLRDDRARGLEVAINAYEPGTASAESALHHDGFEYGIVIQGRLVVELDGALHRVNRGDLISYDSTRPHRISNESTRLARALWINLDR